MPVILLSVIQTMEVALWSLSLAMTTTLAPLTPAKITQERPLVFSHPKLAQTPTLAMWESVLLGNVPQHLMTALMGKFVLTILAHSKEA
jgi:hypothetical protein